MVSRDSDGIDRRSFIEKTAGTAGVAGLASLAGCNSSSSGDGNGSKKSSKGDLGKKVPQYTYLNNPQSYSPPRHDAINLIAAQLKKAGFDMKVKTMEWGSLYSNVTKTRDYDFCTWWTGFNVDPGVFVNRHFHSSNTDPGAGNYAGYKNSDLDPKLKKQIGIIDSGKRAKMFADIETTLKKDVPMMPIVQMPDLAIYNSDQTSNWKHQRGYGYNSFWTMINVQVNNAKNRLVGVWPESIKTLNMMSSDASKVVYNTAMMYDRLVQFDGDFNPHQKSSFATNWKRVDDKTIEYTIRTDHSWHDGKPVTAKDVAFSYNYITKKEVPIFSLQTQYIDKMEVVNDSTVRLHLAKTVGPVHVLISSRIPIIPKHKWQSRNSPSQASVDKPVGSGPLQFDYWNKGSELGLKAYDNHFTSVNYDQRIWRVIPQKSTQYNLLKKGHVHYLPFGGISRQLNKNQQNSSIGVKKSIGTSFWHMTQNNRSEGLDKTVQRQAAVNCIPRTAIAKQVLYGFADPGTNIVSKAFGDLHSDDVPTYKEGTDAAKSRLSNAGYGWDSDGKLHFPSN